MFLETNMAKMSLLKMPRNPPPRPRKNKQNNPPPPPKTKQNNNKTTFKFNHDLYSGVCEPTSLKLGVMTAST